MKYTGKYRNFCCHSKFLVPIMISKMTLRLSVFGTTKNSVSVGKMYFGYIDGHEKQEKCYYQSRVIDDYATNGGSGAV